MSFMLWSLRRPVSYTHLSIEENVEKTKELVALAHSKGMSIEAEVGSIGGCLLYTSRCV